MTNLYDLSEMVAVVTGGSRGIGLAIARHFLKASKQLRTVLAFLIKLEAELSCSQR
ncbi:hypothetical protein ACFFWD_34200 [Bradyrhizobium erythrophlei]|uniref:hypothetical protein n=1 Tax=Bradyrhizobium erythrophlei TaxID=1437360 RepID=UPI0035EEA3FC